MRKILTILALFFVLSSTMAVARQKKPHQRWADQPFRYEVRVGYGPYQTFLDNSYENNSVYDYQYSDGRLSSIYGYTPRLVKTTGSFSAEFGMNFKSWLTVSIAAGVTGYTGREWLDSYSDEWVGVGGIQASLMPQVRFNWLSRKYCRLYSSIGMGLFIDASDRREDVGFSGSFQMTPFGISFGHRFFGFAELGGGTLYSGVRAGIGYNF